VLLRQTMDCTQAQTTSADGIATMRRPGNKFESVSCATQSPAYPNNGIKRRRTALGNCAVSAELYVN